MSEQLIYAIDKYIREYFPDITEVDYLDLALFFIDKAKECL